MLTYHSISSNATITPKSPPTPLIPPALRIPPAPPIPLTPPSLQTLQTPPSPLADATEEMNKSFDEFDGDNNMGLAKQLLEALTSRRIQRLTHTYITLSLTDIAQNVGLAGPAEAEARLVRMIDKGRIFARIDQVSGCSNARECEYTHVASAVCFCACARSSLHVKP